jgi:hypothetical protein
MAEKEELELVEVQIRGTRPLLMHSPKSIGQGRDDRSGTRHDPKEEAEASLYRNKEGKIVVPSLNLLSAIQKAVVDYKVPGKGKKTYKTYIFSGLRIEPEEISIITDGGGENNEGWTIDTRPVVIQRSRIMRARPRFDNWSLKFKIKILDPIIRMPDVKEILGSAGRYVGLCDFRPLFGLFEIVEFERMESSG